MSTIVSSPLSTRNHLPRILVERDLVHTAVEIGTHQGDFAEILLRSWPGFLHCVDPWEDAGPEYDSQLKFLWGDGDRTTDRELCTERLEKYKDRCLMLQMTSQQANERIDDGSLDFVYVDGNHLEQYVRQDLNLWWPKLKKGGILAGHDFICPGEVSGGWGREIQPAVIDFIRCHQVECHVIVEEHTLPWSYYIFKD